MITSHRVRNSGTRQFKTWGHAVNRFRVQLIDESLLARENLEDSQNGRNDTDWSKRVVLSVPSSHVTECLVISQ